MAYTQGSVATAARPEYPRKLVGAHEAAGSRPIRSLTAFSKSLLAAQVSLRRLDANVTKQELDLLKLSASLMTQARAGPTQVVWSNIFDATFRRASFHHAPDHLRTDTGLSNTLGLIDGPKYRAVRHSGGMQPIICCRFDPDGNWHGPHVAALADQISDDPMIFPLLQCLHC